MLVSLAIAGSIANFVLVEHPSDSGNRAPARSLVVIDPTADGAPSYANFFGEPLLSEARPEICVVEPVAQPGPQVHAASI
jgi:hypothetical protein